MYDITILSRHKQLKLMCIFYINVVIHEKAINSLVFMIL